MRGDCLFFGLFPVEVLDFGARGVWIVVSSYALSCDH